MTTTLILAALLRPSPEWPVPCASPEGFAVGARDDGAVSFVWSDPDIGGEWLAGVLCDVRLPAVAARVVHLLAERDAGGGSYVFAWAGTSSPGGAGWTLLDGAGVREVSYAEVPDGCDRYGFRHVPGLAACGNDRAAALTCVARARPGGAP